MVVSGTMPAQLMDKKVLRRKSRRAVAVRRRRLAALSLLLAVLVIAFVWVSAANTKARGAQLASGSPSGQQALSGALASEVSRMDAHPVFAKVRSKSLLLPVPLAQVTIVAYSSLEDELAVPLTPIGRRMDTALAARGATAETQPEGVPYYIFEGKGRNGGKTTAVDIGAPAGAPVVSPVSGTVAGIRQYKLFGKYDDVRIEIRPQGISEVLVTLLLIQEPQVSIGESVVAGKTLLGAVRASVPELAQKLAIITGDQGAHVHLQVTESPSSVD